MDFTSFNLHSGILQRAIPYVMQGEDVLGLAQTGTGKTAAFALPILHHLRTGSRNRVRALILAPTRELAEQINDSIIELGRNTGLRSLTVYGGVSAKKQLDGLRKGAGNTKAASAWII